MSKAEIIPVFEVEEPQQKADQKVNVREGNNCIGDLNPRYFERVRSLKQAKISNMHKYGSLQSFF
jgi:hypothetical protein